MPWLTVRTLLKSEKYEIENSKWHEILRKTSEVSQENHKMKLIFFSKFSCKTFAFIMDENMKNYRTYHMHFRNKKFLLDEMTWWNASKFAMFYIYENPKLLFPFFISCYFIFSPNECPGLCLHRPGHSLRQK